LLNQLKDLLNLKPQINKLISEIIDKYPETSISETLTAFQNKMKDYSLTDSHVEIYGHNYPVKLRSDTTYPNGLSYGATFDVTPWGGISMAAQYPSSSAATDPTYQGSIDIGRVYADGVDIRSHNWIELNHGAELTGLHLERYALNASCKETPQSEPSTFSMTPDLVSLGHGGASVQVASNQINLTSKLPGQEKFQGEITMGGPVANTGLSILSDNPITIQARGGAVERKILLDPTSDGIYISNGENHINITEHLITMSNINGVQISYDGNGIKFTTDEYGTKTIPWS
jgi:hypothetical protein